MDELADLEQDIDRQEEAGLEAGAHYLEDSGDDDDDDSISLSQSPERTRRHRKSSSARRLSGMVFFQKKIDAVVVAYSCKPPVPGPSGYRRDSVSSVEGGGGGGSGSHPLESSTFTFPKRMDVLTNKFQSLRESWHSGTFGEGNNIWTARTDYAYDVRILFKRRITQLYITFTNLRNYIDLNYSGFRKIIKKYDKVTYSELKDKYLHEVVEIATPFTRASKDKVNDGIHHLEDLYARCVTHDDRVLAKRQLRLHQRENIAWERDTVWRQMIGRERRGEGSSDALAGATVVREPEKPLVDITTPVGHFKITGKLIWGAVAVTVFAVLLNSPVVKEGPAANNCFAILVFCTILWASEVRFFSP